MAADADIAVVPMPSRAVPPVDDLKAYLALLTGEEARAALVYLVAGVALNDGLVTLQAWIVALRRHGPLSADRIAHLQALSAAALQQAGAPARRKP